MRDMTPAMMGALAGSAGAAQTPDELQSLLVALLALVVREVVYWWRNRRKST